MLALAAAAIAVAAAPAFAHAVLERATPGDGETLETAPTEVRLEFNEPVSPPVGAVRVFDSEGTRVDEGVAESDGGRAIVAPLQGNLRDGSYVVSWRAVSADGHPVRGAYFFYIGTDSDPIDDSALSEMLGAGSDRPYAIGGSIARWLTYVAALLAIGATIFLRLVSTSSSAATVRMIQMAAIVGMVTSAIQIPIFAAQTTGLGLSALTSVAALGDAVASTVGTAALLRIVGFAALALAVGAGRLQLATIPAALLVAAELWTGHTRTSEPAWLVWGADAIHVAGAALWFGGLVALAIALRAHYRNDDPAASAGTIARFSGLAAVSVIALTIAGLALTWTQVKAWHALTSTTYGWLLLSKLAVVVLVFGFAIYNNRVLVPAITAETVDDGDRKQKAWRRLGRTVRWEIGGIVAALAITAVLVNVQPAAEAAGVSGAYSTFVDFGDGQINLVVDPNRTGMNDIHIYLLTAGGLPAIAEGGITLEMMLPAEEIGPFVREAQFAGPGHFQHTGPELAIAGTWQITIRQRVSEFSIETVTVPVVVNR